MNFYELLGVKTTATIRQIKSAYRRKAMECHPDLNPDDPKAEEKIAKLNEAYETLIDEDKRAYYDRNGKIKREERSKEEVDRFIVVCFEEMINTNGVEVLNNARPFVLISQNLNRKLHTERDRIPVAEREIAVQERLKSRLIYKGEGKNPLEIFFEREIDVQKDIITNAGVAIDLIEATLKRLPEFDWQEAPPENRMGSLQLPGRGRPRFTDEMRGYSGDEERRRRGDYTQDELRRIHDQNYFR